MGERLAKWKLAPKPVPDGGHNYREARAHQAFLRYQCDKALDERDQYAADLESAEARLQGTREWAGEQTREEAAHAARLTRQLQEARTALAELVEAARLLADAAARAVAEPRDFLANADARQQVLSIEVARTRSALHAVAERAEMVPAEPQAEPERLTDEFIDRKMEDRKANQDFTDREGELVAELAKASTALAELMEAARGAVAVLDSPATTGPATKFQAGRLRAAVKGATDIPAGLVERFKRDAATAARHDNHERAQAFREAADLAGATSPLSVERGMR